MHPCADTTIDARRPASAVRSAALALALLAAAPILAPDSRASNGAAPIAIGGRAAGRGGADTAIADDSLSGVHHNPAGMLIAGDRLRADLQDMIVYAAARYADDLNDIHESGVSGFAPSLGVVLDPRWGEPADVPLRIGFGVAGHYGSSGSTRVRTRVYPEGAKESLDFALVKAGPTFAIEPVPGLRLGVGLFYNYFTFAVASSATSDGGSTAGIVRDFNNRQPDGSPTPVRDSNNEIVTWNDLFALAGDGDSDTATLFEFEKSVAHGFNGSFGLQYDVNEHVTIGLSYTSPTFFVNKLEGTGKVDAARSLENLQSDPDVGAIIGPVIGAYLPNGQNADLRARYKYRLEGMTPPQIVSLGVAVTPHERVQLALDGRWINWRTMYRKVDAFLTGGTSADINEINGGDSVKTGTEPDWSDMFVLAFGTSIAATDWLTLRFGYNYATNPYPENRLSPGAIAWIEHHVTAGATVRFDERWSATLALVYNIREEHDIGRHETTPDYSHSSLAAEQLFAYIGVALDL